MGVVSTATGAIGVIEQGTGNTAPIIFLHGVGSDKQVWRPQIAHFGRTRRAVACDYPGYGESQPIAGAGRDDIATAIFAAMDALAIKRAHICGLSLGGVIAIAMHALAPPRCASLILADSFGVHPDGQEIYQRSIDASRSMSMRDLAEARVDLLLGSAAGPELRAEVIETMAAIDPVAYRIGAAAVWLADQRQRVADIAVPALVLCGAEDRVTPPALSEELARSISGARCEMIAGAGHLSNAEEPRAFNAAIDRFLTETEANSS